MSAAPRPGDPRRHDPALLEAAGAYCTLPGILADAARAYCAVHGPGSVAAARLAALALADQLGGDRLDLPRHLTGDHPLCRVLGQSVVGALAEALHWRLPTRVHIPAADVEITWLYARLLRARGMPITEVRRVLRQRHAIRITVRRIEVLTADLAGRRRPGRACPPEAVQLTLPLSLAAALRG